MTKRIVALAALICLLGGCGAKEQEQAVSIDPNTAASTILDQVEFQDTLVKAEDAAVDMYYKMNDSIVDFAIYVSGSGGTAEEIAVLQTADASTVSEARAVVDKRIDDLKFRFEDYVPKEMVKLSDPVIVEKGNTVILVVADDFDAAKAAVDSLF